MGRSRTQKENQKEPKFQPRSIQINPRNESQKLYLKLLNDNSIKILITTGPAGCGKTALAVKSAVKHMEEKKCERIVFSRPNVSVDESIGYLPGDVIKKMEPWMKPITDELRYYYSLSHIQNMIKNETLEFAPIAFIRGRTFINSWVIVDEAQNTKSPDTMKSILTRIGEGSKMVICGDTQQTDFYGKNGLEDIVSRIKDKHLGDIELFEFYDQDIVREKVVQTVLSLY